MWTKRPGNSRVYQALVITPPGPFAAAPRGGHIEAGQSVYCPVAHAAMTSNVSGFQPSAGSSSLLTFNPNLPDGITWSIRFNGYGAVTGPRASANIIVQLCNTLPTAQSLPGGQQVFANQIQAQ